MMSSTKNALASKTIWGIIITVIGAVTVPAWQGYREGGDWLTAVDKALPALIAVLPGAALGTYGRTVAHKPLK